MSSGRPCRSPCTPGDLPSLGFPRIARSVALGCPHIIRSNGLGCSRMASDALGWPRSDGLGRMTSDAQHVGTCMAHAISCSSSGRHGDLGRIAPECLNKYLEIAFSCVHHKGNERPAMGEVEVTRELALEQQNRGDAEKEAINPCGQYMYDEAPISIDAQKLMSIPSTLSLSHGSWRDEDSNSSV
ncbi:hypothetical protein F3Y22_tig00110729pilonHSYRG00112 [Hibiscus syriacus]|uniref:Uncharacterized protein n=1 Tax=Hibiscus syriacus TaxID=106335 RepID=A0A6A2ZUZ1_HIBSY|nr:hypothetical protein F3Y22_tig00110729pilonHSYRG00112 [Hibiscus syriacus]